MKKHLLGSTELWISPLGIGTVKLGRNQGVKYPNSFSIPDDTAARNLLACARDLGVNLLDTAPAYGSSEERLGDLLKEQREQWVIVSKAGEEFDGEKSFYDFSPESITASVERSLKRLKTDYIDMILIHSNGEDEKIIKQDEALSSLHHLKQRGLIRAYGMSTKTVEGGLLAVEQSDVVMVTCHPGYETELPVIHAAAEKKKGVLIKKAFASGHLNSFAQDKADPVLYAMQFIFSQPGVSSVITGTINPEHLKQNVLAVEKALKVCGNEE